MKISKARSNKIVYWLVLALLVLALTITTQIGGVILMLALMLSKWFTRRKRILTTITFVSLYAVSTFIIAPKLAPLFGREKLHQSNNIQSHNVLYQFANRNYVSPALNDLLINVSLKLEQKFPGIQVVCLDANFPFIDRFPLLPHLSHNDGKKIDISLVYKDKEGIPTNLKPSRSGYGIFAEPNPGEFNQIQKCLSNGYFQYDYPKWLTFGTANDNLELSTAASKALVEIIAQQNSTQKIFIEPHLKNRMNLTSSKIRFHGCRAVRHDDHIHLQIH